MGITRSFAWEIQCDNPGCFESFKKTAWVYPDLKHSVIDIAKGIGWIKSGKAFICPKCAAGNKSAPN